MKLTEANVLARMWFQQVVLYLTLCPLGRLLLSADNFANSLDLDQARQMYGLIWIQTVLTHGWY